MVNAQKSELRRPTVSVVYLILPTFYVQKGHNSHTSTLYVLHNYNFSQNLEPQWYRALVPQAESWVFESQLRHT